MSAKVAGGASSCSAGATDASTAAASCVDCRVPDSGTAKVAKACQSDALLQFMHVAAADHDAGEHLRRPGAYRLAECGATR
jgi:hypothetical protein